MAAALYWLVVLSIPFLLVGFVLVGVLAQLKNARWRHTLRVLFVYLVFAAYLGVAAYFLLPAHYMVEETPDRGTAQSMWEMHGEELSYAEQYADPDPPRHKQYEERVSQERVQFVQLWSIPTIAGFIATLLLSSHVTRKWQLRATTASTIVAGLALTACAGSDLESSSSEEQLPITERAAGFEITLTDVERVGERTELAFRIEDADPHHGPDIQYYDGVLTPLDVEVDGIARSESRRLGGMSPIKDESLNTPLPIVAFEQRLILGPLDDPDEPVTVTITRLRFREEKPGQQARRVDGEWSFTFTLAGLGHAETTTVPIDRQARADDVTLAIDELTLSEAETTVIYRIEDRQSHNLELTGLVARLPDRSFVYPDVQGERDGGEPGRFARFEQPLPAGETVTFVLPAVLSEVPDPVSVTIPVGEEVKNAEPGTSVGIGEPVTVGGEPLEITTIDIRSEEFNIRVENRSGDQAGEVLLRMPRAEAELTDDLGNSYQVAGASTNFAKSSAAKMWADGSTFSFAGEVEPEASELTLRVGSYARQLGPWQVDVQIPET